ncbi:MAG: transporter substrate-binding domain-containing protein, partial [Desulfovibrio sp.]|nr:transporter substrate-binding domain-containing protein [Desulfovibrio sp.]
MQQINTTNYEDFEHYFSGPQQMIHFKILYFFLAGIFLLAGFAECAQSSTAPAHGSVFAFYRDIPGVTKEEIAAVEALRKQFDSFVYADQYTTETFDDGSRQLKGFSALLCDWLTALFGIPFKPAIYEWGDQINGLSSHEIDFAGNLTATDERLKTYYMTEAIAEHFIKYFRIMGSEDFSTIEKSRPLRHAFLKGATTSALVSPHISYPYEALYIEDYKTAYHMLKSGEIDAFFEEGIAEAAFDVYGDVVATDFFPLIYGPVSLTTQNPDLEPIISIVQKALQNGAIRHLTDLYNLGQQEYMKHKLFLRLTEEERAYINKHISQGQPVSIATEFDNYPVSFYNTQEKRWQGIAIDVLSEIEALTGLDFKRPYAGERSWPELLGMLERGEAALISELIWSKERD